MRLLAVLVLLLGLAATQADRLLVSSCILPLLVSLIAIHIDRNGDDLAETVVSFAALALPQDERADWRAEWIDHVKTASEHGLAALTRALSILLIAAPTLAIGLRVGRRASKRRAS